MSKGEATRKKILEKAMSYASIYGLSNVTIGEISKAANMSRTGVISHFKDKEDMQISIIKYSELKYIEEVIEPSRDPDSLKRLRNYFHCWQQWIDKLQEDYNGGSCPFIKGMVEYQDREDSGVRSYIQKQQGELLSYITKIVKRCIDDGHLKKETDPEQFAFQAYSYYFGYNVIRNLYDKSKAQKYTKEAIEEMINGSLVSH